MSELFMEIGMEEIPAGYLEPSYRFLGEELSAFFKKNRIEFYNCRTLGTPRRLIVAFSYVQEIQADLLETHLGLNDRSKN